MKSRTELTEYSDDDVDAILKNVAHMKIIGNFFMGEMGEQRIEWLETPAGGVRVRVITEYSEYTWEDWLAARKAAVADAMFEQEGVKESNEETPKETRKHCSVCNSIPFPQSCRLERCPYHI